MSGELSSDEKKELIKKLLRKKKETKDVIKKQENISLEDIPKSYYSPAEAIEIKSFRDKFNQMSESGVKDPFFKINERYIKDTTQIAGKEYVSFSSYNYLGLSGDQRVNDAVKKAIDKYGTSVSASRMVTGERPIHQDLEKEIASFIGVDDAIVFVGGHSTNVTTIGHLFGTKDLVIHDSLAHNSIIQGAILSGARRLAFPHNDLDKLEDILIDNRNNYEKVLIAIEGVYSVDGDIPDLKKFIKLKNKYKAWLLVDEAHSIGVLGKNGRGISEYYGIDPENVELWMGTLSKSFASCGGYIAGNSELIWYLKYTVPGFMFSVGITPANTIAALQAIQVLKKEPYRAQQAISNARFFLEEAKKAGFNTGLSKGSTVVPIVVGNSLKCVQLTNYLFEKGINVSPILYPAVPEDEARLRFFITKDHSQEQLMNVIEVLINGFNELLIN